MSDKISFPARIEKAETRSDRSVKLTLATAKEHGGKDTATFFDLVHTEGFFVYSPNDDIVDTDIPEEKADTGTGEKTPGQRLRAVLYVFWEQSGKKTTFEEFYRTQMERLVNHIKDKLE